jgi:hypothetical protein
VPSPDNRTSDGSRIAAHDLAAQAQLPQSSVGLFLGWFKFSVVELLVGDRSVEDAAQAIESIEPTKKPLLNNCRCAATSSSLSVARRAIPDSVENIVG